MKRNKGQPTPAWIVDYSAARAQAIRWLGDRYLLATPINRKPEARHTLQAALGSRPVGSAPPAPSVKH